MTPERLEALYSSIIHDVLRSRDLTNQVLPYDIRPLSDGWIVAGRAFPVSGRQDSSLTADDSLLAWTRFLAQAPEGSIVMLAANDDNYSHMGELSAETLMGRKVRGFITDGGSRDLKMVRQIGFPVWCRYVTPSDIVGRWIIDEMGSQVVIGGTSITPDDWVIADDDGIVVIPGDVVDEVVEEAERLVSAEYSVREAIRGGMAPDEAYEKYRKF